MISLTLPWKNAMRKPARFWLTCLSIVVAFFLFTVIAAINVALNSTDTNDNRFRLMTTHKSSITKSIPLRYQQSIRALGENIENVTYVSWFGGFFRDESNQLQAVAVDAESYFDIYPEYILSSEAKANWQNVKSGIIISQQLADEFHWRVGDKVPVQSTIWISNDSGSFTWEFEVTGIYYTKSAETNQQMFFLRHDYFDEVRGYGRYNATWLTTRTSRGADIDAVSQSIDKLFENSPAETRTTTEQAFIKEQAQQFVDLSWALRIVVLAVFFTLLLIASNSMSQSVRERMNEIAVMKSLGFSSGQLVLFVYIESFIIIFFGALVGALAAAFSVELVQQTFSAFLPGIHIQASHYFLVVIMVSLLAAFCSLSPAVKIYRLPISETLRT